MAYKLVSRACLYCGALFQARNPQQRFCAKPCAHYSRLSLADHLWQRVHRCCHGDGCAVCCWEWQGWCEAGGYGVFEHQGATYKAHIAAYMSAHGLITRPTLSICHSCDNPPCCNPSHLWLRSQQENMQDAARKGRLTNRPRGEQHMRVTLTTTDVRQIRALRAAGWTFKAIHGLFPSAGRTTIQNIGSGKSRGSEYDERT